MSRDFDATIPQLFGLQVAWQPHHPALQTAHSVLTYAALDEYSNRLARGVWSATMANAHSKKSPVAHPPIALLMTHDAPLLAAILGVLKARRTYVALDVRSPYAHLETLLRDATPALLITDSAHLEMARRLSTCCAIWNVDELSDGDYDFNFSDPTPRDAACIFYTSGSTGAPKGVLQNHRCVIHTARNYIAALGISPADKVLLSTACSVGASSSVVFGALLGGATLCPFDLKNSNVASLVAWMQSARISVLHCVPSLFRRILESLSHQSTLPDLRVVKLGGEIVTRSEWERFQNAIGRGQLPADCRFINGLGITEAGGNVCFYEMRRGEILATGTVPVGYAAPGYSLSLTAQNELVAQSEYLAEGYWNRAASENFENSNFQTRPDGARIYRTGDLARIAPNGCVEYLSRKDELIKIRGQRVETEYVEAALREYSGAHAAAIIAVRPQSDERDGDERDGDLQLIGCLSASASTAADESEKCESEKLRRALSATLPDYMVPARLVWVDEWPLLPGGKTDRSALKQLVTERDQPAPSPVSTPASLPLSDVFSARVQQIWQKALRVKNIGEDDNFFALGGHSLAAADICTALHHEFNLDAPLTAFAQFPTLAGFSSALRDGILQRHPRLIRLKSETENAVQNAPLWCVPGAGSDGFSLLELARHLETPRAFCALQPPGLDGCVPYPQTVEAFASYHLETLRGAQPHGPYFLCGGSFGGVIAFEMARVLRAQGERVALLALFDSYGAGYPRRRASGWHRKFGPRRVAQWAWHFLPLGDKRPTLRNFARGVKERLSERRARHQLARREYSHARRFLHLRVACFAARKRYRPQVFDGKMNLFRVEVQASPQLFEPDETLGWHGLASHGIAIHPLPGKHGSYLFEPNVRILAAQLDALLEAAN